MWAIRTVLPRRSNAGWRDHKESQDLLVGHQQPCETCDVDVAKHWRARRQQSRSQEVNVEVVASGGRVVNVVIAVDLGIMACREQFLIACPAGWSARPSIAAAIAVGC